MSNNLMQDTWEKIAFYELPQIRPSWMVTHCQLPTAMPLDDNTVRIFFAARNKEQISRIGFVDAKISGRQVEFNYLSETPVLSPGGIGTFDEHGVYPSSIVWFNGVYYLYFIGWNRGYEAPLFYASIGLATSKDGINFEKCPNAPILARSEHDPCLVTSPHVFIDGNIWRMTYVSGIQWDRSEKTGRLQSYYHIKYAESRGPINWDRKGDIAINLIDGEKNIARPSVIKRSDANYQMWYSYALPESGKYRIGFAESEDCLIWERKDQLAGISIDKSYAQEMISYPCVFRLGDRYYMLYNGDNFGEKGFGLALWRRN